MSAPVVVTGRGIVSPVGRGCASFWRAHVEGRSGVTREERFDTRRLPCGWLSAHLTDAEAAALRARWGAPGRSFPEILLREAIDQALAESGLAGRAPERVALVLAMIGGEVAATPADYERLRQSVARGVERPVAAAECLLPAELARALGRPVVPIRIEATCTTGLRVVAEGARLVASGRADAAIVASACARLSPYLAGTYAQMMALSRWQGPPAEASRPFDRRRAGMVPADGAAALVLERADAGGARPRARIAGWAFRHGTDHPTRPSVAAMAAVMRAAMAHAGVAAASLDALSAHGTSTTLNDLAEARALHVVFGDAVRGLGICASKAILGHSSVAAGTVELVAATEMLAHDIVPPVATCTDPDPECDLPISTAPIERPIRRVMKNAFGFGGQYGSLILEAVVS